MSVIEILSRSIRPENLVTARYRKARRLNRGYIAGSAGCCCSSPWGQILRSGKSIGAEGVRSP